MVLHTFLISLTTLITKITSYSLLWVRKGCHLVSYISFIFRELGLLHIGNVAWDKGQIEGNRNFNQGNFSPYYQAPLNCWEHVMVFSKGQPNFDLNQLPKHLKAKPVIKIIKGQNTYGHTAPYPSDIPGLLAKIVKKGTVLDPFSGSMTTGITALKHGLNSINIELHKEYCDLSIRLIKEMVHFESQAEMNV